MGEIGLSGGCGLTQGGGHFDEQEWCVQKLVGVKFSVFFFSLALMHTHTPPHSCPSQVPNQ